MFTTSFQQIFKFTNFKLPPRFQHIMHENFKTQRPKPSKIKSELSLGFLVYFCSTLHALQEWQVGMTRLFKGKKNLFCLYRVVRHTFSFQIYIHNLLGLISKNHISCPQKNDQRSNKFLLSFFCRILF